MYCNFQILEEKLSSQRKILIDKQITINNLESEKSDHFKEYTEKDGLIYELKFQNEKIEKEYDEISVRYDRATKEIKKLTLELELKPEKPPPTPPPPPPPPPPPRLCNIFNRKKNRSISLSRIENHSTRKKNVPMVLNKDILDAIRNRKYKLKPVENLNSDDLLSRVDEQCTSNLNLTRGRRMFHSMKQFPNMYTKDFSSMGYDNDLSFKGNIIANILKRRVSMEYMNESDDTEDENFTFL